MSDSLNRTAFGVATNGINATSGGGVQMSSAASSWQGMAQGGIGGASSSLSNCGSFGWYPHQYQQPYTYYYYPYIPYQPAKPTVAETIALYKKEFGKDWKRMFAQTVKVEAR